MFFAEFIKALSFEYIERNQLNILCLKGVTCNRDRIIVNNDEIDKYNDLIICLKDDIIEIMPGTVDPGLYYSENPLNSKGTAHVAFGQHKFVKGLHHRKYKALRAKDEKIWIVRDYNRNYIIDDGDIFEYARNTGVNCHAMGIGENIGKNSAGCLGPFGGWNGNYWKSLMNYADMSYEDEFPFTVWHGKDYLNFLDDQCNFNPTLRFGTIQNNVKDIQMLLGLDFDGVFGKNTSKAVKKFQENNDLTSDGIVGKNTWKNLLK